MVAHEHACAHGECFVSESKDHDRQVWSKLSRRFSYLRILFERRYFNAEGHDFLTRFIAVPTSIELGLSMQVTC